MTRPALLLTLAVPALLAGCSYTVDVYNNTSQDLVLEIVQVDPLAPDWVLASDRVAAGHHHRFGPERVHMGAVAVSIVTERDREKHIRERLVRGHSVWDIYEREGEHGPVLELVRRDGKE
jgi:hypothetical protein